jgi:three-Cys-motif partner protein
MSPGDTDPYPLLFPDMTPSSKTADAQPEVLLPSIEIPIWTQHKAFLIARYLHYFTYVTKHGAYIDGFAGPQYADMPDLWAAKLALLNKPGRIRKYFLFDKDPRQVERIEAMVSELPPQDASDNKRVITVEPGDCNVKIRELLDKKLIGRREATFALLDQRNFECEWQTLVSLATYKPEDCNKIELFYFLPSAWFHRSAKNRRREERIREIDAWWGNEGWGFLKQLGPWGRMLALRERFEKELGYRYVTPLPIYESENGCGTIMYFMIHASDHSEAPKLMRRAYGLCVTRRLPAAQMPLLPTDSA